MEGKLFVSVIRQLNPTYNDLLLAYSKQDTRISYLRSFELILSACLRDDILEKDPKYIELEEKLHTHKRYKDIDIMPPEEFWLWIKNLEQIMRDEGLIGNSGDGDDGLVLDMVGLDPFLAPRIKRLRNGMAVLREDDIPDDEESDEESEDAESEDSDDSDDEVDESEGDEDESEEDVNDSEEEADPYINEEAPQSEYYDRPPPVFGVVPGEMELRNNQFDADAEGIEALIAENPMYIYHKKEDVPDTEVTDDTDSDDSDDEEDESEGDGDESEEGEGENNGSPE